VGKLNLEFKPIKKGTEYAVSLDWDSNIIDDIEVPATYNGLPVTAIKAEGFWYSVGSIKLPDSIKSIGYKAFEDNRELKGIDFPGGLTSIGYSAFKNCGLTSVFIPEKIKNVGNPQAFSSCVDLAGIEVSPKNKALTGEGNCLIEIKTGKLLCGCKTSVIPYYVTSIDFHAFFGCSGLTEIIIPDSVTEIGGFAFSKCSNLSKLTIPAGVNIKGFAFRDTENITEIFFNGDKAEWDLIDKQYNPELSKAKVHFK